MADKLSEASWTGYTKKAKLDLEDGPLLKALARYDKTDEAKPEPRAEALEDVVEQLKKQVTAQSRRKKELGDKVFGEIKDKLYGLLEIAESQLKECQAAIRAAAESGDEEESPALLTTKMIPLIRELRKGDTEMQALVALAGKETVVLLSRRAISPARGKLLKEQMTNPGGLKFVRAECRFEDNALTFIVQAPAAGLAKKIKAALLKQTELRLPVRVRGEDGDADEDEDDEGSDGTGTESDAGGDATAGESDAPGDVAAQAQQAYAERLRALQDRLRQALATQHPESTRLRALIGFASEKAAGKDFAAALKALDQVQKLLDAPVPDAKASGDVKVDAGAAFNARLAALLPRIKDAIAAGGPAAQDLKLRTSEAGLLARKGDHAGAHALLDAVEAALPSGRGTGSDAGGKAAPTAAAMKAAAKSCLETWLGAKEAADVGLSRLQSALKASDDPALKRIAEFGLAGVSRGLQVGLRVALQEFALASDPAKQAPAAERLRASVADFRRFLTTDAALRLCDENPFDIRVDLRPTLGAALKRIEDELDALQA